MTTTTTTTTFVPVALTALDSSVLPSQAGQRGRPRKSGRVTVRGSDLDRRRVQLTLAERFQVAPTAVTFYARESSENALTFVVPGVDLNTRLSFASAPSEDLAAE